MATILSIDFAGRAASRENPAPDAGPKKHATAELILFPGVRYQRWEAEKAPSTAAKPRRRRQRDRLELQE
jgi:hypothetical protein